MLWIPHFYRTQWERSSLLCVAASVTKAQRKQEMATQQNHSHRPPVGPAGAHFVLSSGRVNQLPKVFNGPCEHPQRVVTAFRKEVSVSSTILVVQAITDQPSGREIDPSLPGVHVFLEREATLGGHLLPTLSTKGTAVAKPWGGNGLGGWSVA